MDIWPPAFDWTCDRGIMTKNGEDDIEWGQIVRLSGTFHPSAFVCIHVSNGTQSSLRMHCSPAQRRIHPS